MAGLSANMEALKRNFLLRGFFNRRGYFTLADISPDEYRKGALTAGGDRRALRVWLRDDVIFERAPGPNGDERLTEDGKARLDSALGATVSRLADGVLMVEGYARDGSVTDRHMASRARAVIVRQYLVTRFHLDPDAVGVMPLGSAAVGESPAGDTWSGIALAVFLEK
jgi:phospholipid/cholesterol/gamma-HCH transport system substrate-binding protein